MPNTAFTDIKANPSRHKCHSTARFYTSQDLNAVAACSPLYTSDDLCPQTFGAIIEARAARGEFELAAPFTPALEHGHDNPLLVPSSRASNSLYDAGRELSEEEQGPQEQIEDRLFDVLVHTDVLQGVDANGTPRKMRMDILIVRMRAPGGDAGQLLNCLRNAMPGIVLPLTNVLSHMSLSLRLPSSGVNLNDVFNPGVRHNISMLTAEAQMLPAVFNVAARNDIHNVHWRGVVYDPRSPREVRVYDGMLQGVLAARAHHFRVVTMGCNRDTRPSFKKQDQPMAGFGARPRLSRALRPRCARLCLACQCVRVCAPAPAPAPAPARDPSGAQARRSSSTAACTT